MHHPLLCYRCVWLCPGILASHSISEKQAILPWRCKAEGYQLPILRQTLYGGMYIPAIGAVSLSTAEHGELSRVSKVQALPRGDRPDLSRRIT